MHLNGTLSLPFLLSLLPKDATILSLRISCEVKRTDSAYYYETKCRLCADGSRMIVGVDYNLSSAPVIEREALFLTIALAASKSIQLFFLDISNAFQSNAVHCPSKRHHIHIQSLYMS